MATCEQECVPLVSLEELWNWRAGECPVVPDPREDVSSEVVIADKLYDSITVMPRIKREIVPKTLLCHDMCGGYLEDRFIRGGRDATAYRFWHWSMIDIFCYFSHKFVTIPPVGWIQAAHTHGVSIIGTVITEHDKGAEVCAEFLSSEEAADRTVNQLVSIAQHYRFDGWLLNLENKVPKDRIDVLVYFIERLTKCMKEYSSISVVIWYDSVTTEGKLDWQNQLNNLNERFFDACSGIFLNYTWTKENIRHSMLKAGSRKTDVYVGVDVFGRGCFGGGGLYTEKAVSLIRSFGLSVAIFAPGWTYEKHCKEEFLEMECLFWRLLYPYMFLHGPTSFPLITSFCQGVGLREYSKSECVSKNTWYNLSKQQLQPMHPGQVPVFHQAFNGGSCLLLTARKIDGEYGFFRLFSCDYDICQYIYVRYCYKHAEDLSSSLAFVLGCKGIGNKETTNWIYFWNRKSNLDLDGRHLMPNKVFNHDTGWTECEYKIEADGSILEIGILVVADSSIFLGSIHVDSF